MIHIRIGGPGEGKRQKEKKQKRPQKTGPMKWLKARKTSATKMTLRRPPDQTLNSDYIVSRDERILVTGSSGFIGSKVVEKLLEYGFANLRCFVRRSSYLDRLEKVLSQFDVGRN